MFEQVARSGRGVMTFALVVVLMMGSLVSPGNTVAQSQTLQSSLTGVTIAYEAPYQLFEEGQYSDDAMETMMFVGPADILAMGFMTPLIDINGARDIMLEALFGEMGDASTIDRGDYTGVSYSLDMLNIDGAEMGVFSLFMNQRSHGYAEFYIFLAPPTLFGTSMQTVQNSFTIDGAPLMDGVDPIVMGNMVTSNIGITGGEAVTDVTEVTETEDPGTGTDTTTPSGDTTGEGDQIIYLLDVMIEYSAVDNSIVTILETLMQFSEDEIAADAAFDIISEEARFLSGVNDRVSIINVPAGMQDFHQETLQWANDVTAVGTTWIDFVEGRGTDSAASSALDTAVDSHIAFGDSLQAQQISSNESQGTSESGESTTTSPETEVGDADAYIAAIYDHRGEFVTSLGLFNDSLSILEGDPTDAQVTEAFDGSLVEAEKWAGYSATAQQLTPPAGYEDVHVAYLSWAGHVTELGNIWIAALNLEEGQFDAFFEYLPLIQQADTDLQVAIDAAGSGDSGSSVTSGETDTTETTGTTTRTTRTTSTTDDDDEAGNTSETTSRTTRSTGTTDDEEDENDESSTGTSRTSRTSRTTDEPETGEDSGNTSETSGRTSRTERGSTDAEVESTAGSTDLQNEWLGEQNNVSITWSDDLVVSDLIDEPQVSDSATGEDTIYLQAELADGSIAPVWVTVVPNPGSDATQLVNMIVDDPAAAENIWGPGTVVHDYRTTAGESAALMHAEDEIGGYWIYFQATCLDSACDSLALLEIAVEGAPLIEMLEITNVGLAVDGVTISAAMPASDVEAIVEQIGD